MHADMQLAHSLAPEHGSTAQSCLGRFVSGMASVLLWQTNCLMLQVLLLVSPAACVSFCRYFLEPQKRRDDESVDEFAARVQAMIAKQVGGCRVTFTSLQGQQRKALAVQC